MQQPLIIILIIAVYFFALILISQMASSKASNNTYFTGNRNMAWPLVALAMITAPISGLTFISVPGMVVSKGYSYLQMCLGFVVGYFVIAWVLVPLFYKYNIISIYSFLDQRFGKPAYKTGAWLFLISELLGIGVRFMVVCMVLQFLVFQPLNLPFELNVGVTMFLIWLYTAKGGVKSVIWSDAVKSVCLIVSVVLCFFFIVKELGMEPSEVPGVVASHSSSRIFHFDDYSDSSYFWKQFLTGIFLVVAMTGLDQDMMQRVLACKDPNGSQKNMMVSGVIQFFIIALFLALGTVLLLYIEAKGLEMPQKSDDIFATVAYHSDMPVIVSVLFVLGIVSASYSSVGSALTSLTTSYTVDIMEGTKKYDEEVLKRKRKLVHAIMALIMAGVIIACYHLNEQDAISALFTLASFTYGPILGLFAFGVFSKRRINPKRVCVVCVLAPILSWILSFTAKNLWDYNMGYELFLFNAGITLLGLYLLPVGDPSLVSSPLVSGKKLSLIIVAVLTGFAMNAQTLKQGDLIFQKEGSSGFSQAISESTAFQDTVSFIHVGIIMANSPAGLQVIEASPEDGVRILPLQEFVSNSGGWSRLVVKRLNKVFPQEEVLKMASSYVGQPYDWEYRPDNGKIYCSELVVEAFIDEDGNKIFSNQPMNFLDAEGNLPGFWEDLFLKLGTEVPQGVPGSNPNDLSKSPDLETIYFEQTLLNSQ